MLATELDIKKKGKLYQLRYRNKRIRCFSSENFVEHENQELIEFIRDDLYRCGDLKFRKNQRFSFKTTPCAYYLFSFDKSLLKPEYYEGLNFNQFISKYLLFDFLFFEFKNFKQKELLNARKFIKNKIGSENYRKTTLYSCYRSFFCDSKIYNYFDDFELGYGYKYNQNLKVFSQNNNKTFTCEPGTLTTDDMAEYAPSSDMAIGWNRDNFINYEKAWISEKEFSEGEVPKIILELFNECTEFEKTAVLTLFHSNDRYSFLLPLAYIRGWINKRDYISSTMVVNRFKTGNIDYYLYSNHDHQESYKSLNELSVLCFNFANIGTKVQREIWEKIKQGESTNVEFKESLSLDIKESKKKGYQLKKDKKIQDSVLKTIAGFLNSEGGTLFIGVKDRNNEIVGIENEIELLFKSSIDKIQLHLKNLINKAFNAGNPLINFYTIEVFKKNIMVINCSPSRKSVFIDGKFFIRKGPGTDELNTEQYHKYLEQNE
tara:strand:+ start:1429 stop:2892 length:1464 start_codon:yes stop_codon:yes gene_type:complete